MDTNYNNSVLGLGKYGVMHASTVQVKLKSTNVQIFKVSEKFFILNDLKIDRNILKIIKIIDIQIINVFY